MAQAATHIRHMAPVGYQSSRGSREYQETPVPGTVTVRMSLDLPDCSRYGFWKVWLRNWRRSNNWERTGTARARLLPIDG